MSLAPQHHQQHPITTTENNIAYPFRLRHSYGKQAIHTNGGRMFNNNNKSFPDRPDAAVFSGSDSSSPISPTADAEDGSPRFPAAAHLPHHPSARLSHASNSTSNLSSLNNNHLPHSGSPSSADFLIIPSRPPLRPTVSFGGVSGMSYYSSISSEHDRELETRSLSLARVEREELGVKGRTASLTNLSLRKARSLACLWPEARR